MRTPNNGGPAFPRPPFTPGNVMHDACAEAGFAATGHSGMTLRDYFAAAALQGLLACPAYETDTWADFAGKSYLLADAMIAERAKGGAS